MRKMSSFPIKGETGSTVTYVSMIGVSWSSRRLGERKIQRVFRLFTVGYSIYSI